MKRNERWVRGSVVCLWLLAAVGGLVVGITHRTEASDPGPGPERGAVLATALPSLLLGAGDLPFEMVLDALKSGPEVARSHFAGLDTGDAVAQSWAGPLVSKRVCLRTGRRDVCDRYDHCTCQPSPRYSASICLAIAKSPQEAGDAALRKVNSAAAVAPEVTGDARVVAFADRAWYSGGPNITYTRGNVIVTVSALDREGSSEQLALSLAAQVSRRIDAAAAGHPEPATALPPSPAEWGRDLVERAWEMKDAARTFWGAEGSELLVEDRWGFVRSMPGKRLGSDDYLIPVQLLSMCLGDDVQFVSPRKQRDGGTQVTVGARKARFVPGASEISVADQPAVALSGPIESKSGNVVAPLRAVATALGLQVTTVTRDGRSVLRISKGNAPG